MDAKKLEILMTAVDLGSFSRASEVVGYTQSGLTHLVNSLEREIGFPLIVRSHNGISLTEQGRELMPDIRQFLQASCQSGKPDSGHPGKTDGDHPHCGLRQYCHVLDAGDPVPLPAHLPECGCGPSHGGSCAGTVRTPTGREDGCDLCE